MNLTIKDSDNVILDGDNYKVTCNLNCDGIGVTGLVNAYTSNEIIDANWGLTQYSIMRFQRISPNTLKGHMGMLLINTNEDPLADDNYPYSTVGERGVIGGIDLQNKAYIGTATDRGTINLAESSWQWENSLRKATLHLVVDLPTNACNGSFDRIAITPHTIFEEYNNNGTSLKQSDHVQLEVCGEYIIPTQYNTVFAVNSKWMITGNYSKMCISSINNDSKLRNYSIGGINVDSHSPILVINDEFYIADTRGSYYNPTAISFYKLNIIETNGEINCNFNSVTPPPFMTNIPSGANIRILGGCKWDSIYVLLYRRTGTGYFIAAFDDENNLIKELQIPDDYGNYGSKTTRCHPWGEKLLIGHYIIDKNLNFLGYLSAPNGLENSAYYNRGHVWMGLDGKMYGTTPRLYCEDSSYHYASQVRLKPNLMVIDLEEPVHKTNADTLKLIFDFEITIE